MHLLINKTDIQGLKDISNHTTLERIKEYINDAQLMDLCPLLGNDFYFDILANYNDPEYQELLNGGNFDVNGCTWKHEGLKRVLIEFTWGRYTHFGVNNDTAFGNVIKTNEFSQTTSNEDRRDLWKQSQQKANAYFEVIKRYLDLSNNFPKWDKGCNTECGTKKSSEFKYNLI